mmetsp:Transcript_152466/g.269239  ORF Transcript_152466/g.269239 Transcript_152466/m.269239 type:complete len:287 (+) Transcript_152466:630-1490(+)
MASVPSARPTFTHWSCSASAVISMRRTDANDMEGFLRGSTVRIFMPSFTSFNANGSVEPSVHTQADGGKQSPSSAAMQCFSGDRAAATGEEEAFVCRALLLAFCLVPLLLSKPSALVASQLSTSRFGCKSFKGAGTESASELNGGSRALAPRIKPVSCSYSNGICSSRSKASRMACSASLSSVSRRSMACSRDLSNNGDADFVAKASVPCWDPLQTGLSTCSKNACRLCLSARALVVKVTMPESKTAGNAATASSSLLTLPAFDVQKTEGSATKSNTWQQSQLGAK